MDVHGKGGPVDYLTVTLTPQKWCTAPKRDMVVCLEFSGPSISESQGRCFLVPDLMTIHEMAR